MELHREVVLTPAFDKRNADPKKNYGIHGVELRMYLIGEKGAVQFVLFTGWQLPSVGRNHEPLAADLGYHSKTPRYEDQEVTPNCLLLGCDCYYNGSGLSADRIFDVLREDGSEGVWRELESFYRDVFGE